MAGFRRDGRYYFHERAILAPPDILMESIFPFIKTAIESESNERNISFYGFCNLLKELRTVLLQDNVILKKFYSSLEIWQHPVFPSSEYSEFEKLLLHTMKSGVAKNHVSFELESIVPTIATGSQQNGTKMNMLLNLLTDMKNSTADHDATIMQRIVAEIRSYCSCAWKFLFDVQ